MRLRLMAASCALLGAAGSRAQEARTAPADSGLLEDWSVDSALAYYREDGRIQAIEPVVTVAKIFADGQALDLNVTFDSLSGSSPNGALTSRVAQTFSSPSGRASHSYTTAPGQLPVDPNYQDDRIAVGVNWSIPMTRVTELSVGAKGLGRGRFLFRHARCRGCPRFQRKEHHRVLWTQQRIRLPASNRRRARAGKRHGLVRQERRQDQGRGRCPGGGHPGDDAQLAFRVQHLGRSIHRLSQRSLQDHIDPRRRRQYRRLRVREPPPVSERARARIGRIESRWARRHPRRCRYGT